MMIMMIILIMLLPPGAACHLDERLTETLRKKVDSNSATPSDVDNTLVDLALALNKRVLDLTAEVCTMIRCQDWPISLANRLYLAPSHLSKSFPHTLVDLALALNKRVLDLTAEVRWFAANGLSYLAPAHS
jgi:hypothetical protein